MLKCNCGWEGINLIPSPLTNTAHCPQCKIVFQGIEAKDAIKLGSLEVWWIQNPPRTGNRYPVNNIEEAIFTLNALADRDLKNKYVTSNAGGLEVFTEDGWEEYYNEEGDSIDEIMRNRKE